MKHAAPELVREAVYGLLRGEPRAHPRRAAGGEPRLLSDRGAARLPAAGRGGRGRRRAPDRRREVGRERRRAQGRAATSCSRRPPTTSRPTTCTGHRHWPEIRQGLAQAAKRDVGLVFTPHLTPLIRGIHATLYARITKEADFQALFEKRYAGEPFVDVMPAGSHPDTRSVRAANTCRIAVHRPPESAKRSDTLVVLSVIDNLVKGASGQAVQNMNLMFGLPETDGPRASGGGALDARSGRWKADPPALRHRRAARRGPDADPVVLALGRHRGPARRRRRRRLAGSTTPAGASPASIAARCVQELTARAGRAGRRARRARAAARDRQRRRQPRLDRAHRAAEARAAGARRSSRSNARVREELAMVEQMLTSEERHTQTARRSTASRSSPTCCRANTATGCCC